MAGADRLAHLAVSGRRHARPACPLVVTLQQVQEELPAVIRTRCAAVEEPSCEHATLFEACQILVSSCRSSDYAIRHVHMFH